MFFNSTLIAFVTVNFYYLSIYYDISLIFKWKKLKKQIKVVDQKYLQVPKKHKRLLNKKPKVQFSKFQFQTFVLYNGQSNKQFQGHSHG